MTAVGFVFPGQGSQEVGMLRDFFEREAVVHGSHVNPLSYHKDVSRSGSGF